MHSARNCIRYRLDKPPGMLARIGNVVRNKDSLAVISNTQHEPIRPLRHTSWDFITSIFKHLGDVSDYNDIAVTLAVLVVPVDSVLSEEPTGVKLKVAGYGLPCGVLNQFKGVSTW